MVAAKGTKLGAEEHNVPVRKVVAAGYRKKAKDSILEG
jgi:hypothetical protein